MAVVDPQEEFDKEWAKYANISGVKFSRKYYVPLFPPKYACYFKLGDAYYWDKQYEQTINAYQKGLELNPNAPDYYTSMAAAYREMKQYDKAMAAINRAIDLRPSDFSFGVLRSIYEEQG